MNHEKILRMRHLNEAAEHPGAFLFLMCGVTYPNKNYSICRPTSPLSCIEYVISGKGHLAVNGKKYTVKAGDTYFLHEGDDHHYYSDKNDPWTKIWINFTGEHAKNLAVLYGIEHSILFENLDTSDLLQKFQHYVTLKNTAHAAEQCASVLSHLLIRLSRAQYVSQKNEQSPVSRMEQYIEQHAAEALTLEKIASVANKSPSQAERIFRAEKGIPLYRYALNKKIDIACQLLLETGMSVKEISAYLSFSDEFYFSGLFRKRIGLSPNQYRKMRGILPPKKE